MREADRKPFYELVKSVHVFYRQECSAFALGVWWEAMHTFDFDAIAEAFSAYSVNPDRESHFMPMPGDIVRMLRGGTIDQAMLAWSKVDAAVRGVGTYRDVVFDDPLIHAVLHDTGGWLPLGEKDEEAWPFIAKEFAIRYRGYAIRIDRPAYPPVLIGIAGANNRRKEVDVDPPVLLGDPGKARAVMQAGIDRPRLQVTALVAASKLLEEHAS